MSQLPNSNVYREFAYVHDDTLAKSDFDIRLAKNGVLQDVDDVTFVNLTGHRYSVSFSTDGDNAVWSISVKRFGAHRFVWFDNVTVQAQAFSVTDIVSALQAVASDFKATGFAVPGDLANLDVAVSTRSNHSAGDVTTTLLAETYGDKTLSEVLAGLASIMIGHAIKDEETITFALPGDEPGTDPHIVVTKTETGWTVDYV